MRWHPAKILCAVGVVVLGFLFVDGATNDRERQVGSVRTDRLQDPSPTASAQSDAPVLRALEPPAIATDDTPGGVEPPLIATDGRSATAPTDPGSSSTGVGVSTETTERPTAEAATTVAAPDPTDGATATPAPTEPSPTTPSATAAQSSTDATARTTTTAGPTTQPSEAPSGTAPSAAAGTGPTGRLYGGWCRSGPVVSRAPAGAEVVRVQPGASIQDAIDAIGVGVVELAAGVHTIISPIELRSGVVLRGVNRQATIRTGGPMNQMVVLGGGFTGGRIATVQDGAAFATSLTTDRPLTPGLWLIGGTAGGQLVRVVSVSGTRAELELPLAQDVGGLAVAPQNDPITGAGLERVTLEPGHRVTDLVMVRSATDVWVRDVETRGAGGQVRSAIYLRQAYRVGIYGNDIITARELGDGGQGYGINIANNTSNAVIEGNRLERLRHSILLHAGASGNVVRGNTSTDARHPNFIEGGPADLSFHGIAAGNLVQDNRVERIQISDAGRPGPHNALVGNTLTSGPLTLDNGVDQLTLLGNEMMGSVEALRARVMPSIAADSTAGNPSPARSYWRLGYDPFGRSGDTAFDRFGDGILDWGSGDDILVDPSVRSIDPCNL
ncbi:MAG: hypothetical protein AAF547_18910 [Actinomycetota bacterium]